MPIYDLKCTRCGAREDHTLRVAELDSNRPRHCGAPMEIVLHAAVSMVRADCHYVCPATGEKVTTRRKRRYLFEKHGLADADDFKSNVEKTKQRAAKDRDLAAQLYRDVPDAVVNTMQAVGDAELAKLTQGSA